MDLLFLELDRRSEARKSEARTAKSRPVRPGRLDCSVTAAIALKI